MNSNNKMAHIVKSNNVINDPHRFHDFMINEKKHMSKKQKEEWENCYFALCLLIPEKQLLEICDMFGGIYEARKSNEHISALSRLFLVEPIMITTRIDLIKQALEKNEIKEKTIRLWIVFLPPKYPW